MTHGFFEQFLVILCCAVIATTLFRRIQLPPLLAYLSVGALVGPYALGVIEDVHSIEFLSELGVVFLLFMLGLEFSVSRMIAMRKAVFGLGSLQVIITSAVIIGFCTLIGMPLTTSVVIAGALSLSSTAIVSRELIHRNELDTPHGQLSVGTLIFQDLAAVFFLIVVPTLNGGASEINGSQVALMLLEGGTLLIVLLLIGHIVMPMLFHESARSGSSDVFVLTSLAAALLAAWLTEAAGLSMALGGFLAGMMLGESRYRYQLEADIRPFRDVLLGLFFVSVGMQLDLQSLLENWYWVLVFTLCLITAKTLIITFIGSLLHKDLVNSLRAGLSLSQGGEFGFALLALALGSQLISPEINTLTVATIIISMIITPIIMNHTHRVDGLLAKQQLEQEDSIDPSGSQIDNHNLNNHVIICGFGRVGQIMARFLDQAQIPYIAIDNDPVRVMEASTAGEHICFGDARRDDILEAVGAKNARMLILSFPETESSLPALKHIRSRFVDLPILVRTRDDSQLDEFQTAGATEVIPEALEGSLMMISHVLSLLGMPHTKIEKQINTVRAERYHMLHGYYHGRHSSKIDSSGRAKEILHPVTIDTDAAEIGKTLKELKLERFKVTVAMIRRQNHSNHNPKGDTRLKSGDIVVLKGPTDKVELAEASILSKS
ncbi:monovalent cation:proton antiporter family protein [Neptuniibacter caesariensis]|uniref:Glutathione-regulated potassium-efflux system protein n=1 Tax=Neptuniibacter caesariensis TaxID=207954 RepID=A0A7U8C4V7_NEPCE|nr:monovalent cation:proton antiporter family protein [Neptuniibacter caesariensis]EAR61259.1 glutathione-regulated potassium-efflux system protein [Oceanospirillum sp. MED92] [Neptuniibacter caesariensis]